MSDKRRDSIEALSLARVAYYSSNEEAPVDRARLDLLESASVGTVDRKHLLRDNAEFQKHLNTDGVRDVQTPALRQDGHGG
jgi:hypothetical protein